MNNFIKNRHVRKIILILIFLIMFNFIYPNIQVEAMSGETASGLLLNPMCSLVGAIGEGVMDILQFTLLKQKPSNIFIDNDHEDIWLPIYNISPHAIFSNQIPALHINFLDYPTKSAEDSDDSAQILGPVIAKWYVALRNFVLVALMVVLLYLGIRIVISSTAEETAKYKERIKDWLIAVILVVFMHYIMAFAITATEYVTNLLANAPSENVMWKINESQLKEIKDKLDPKKEKGYTVKFEDIVGKDKKGNDAVKVSLIGDARLKQQIGNKERTIVENNWGTDSNFDYSMVGYTIVFAFLVIYTISFIIIYFRRVIYMAFLTMIAPIVALTYPIDKISDGKSQAFDMWLKEYIYNLLLQPFHLLLYTILIGSVMSLASSNIIYTIAVLAFLMPADKLLRSFFGFEKAATTGDIVGGVVGGQLAMNAIKSLGSKVSNKGKKGRSSSGEEGSGETIEDTNIRTADKGLGSQDELIGQGFAENQQATQQRIQQETQNRAQQEALYKAQSKSQYKVQQAVQQSKQQNGKQRENKDNNSNGRKRKIITAARTGAHYTGKILKKSARIGAKGILAGSMGMIGLAAGASTGDLKNAIAFAGGAATIGSKLGDNLSDMTGSLASKASSGVSSASSYIQSKMYSPDEIQSKKNAKLDKEWEYSKDTQKLYQEKFGDNWSEAMDNAKEYRKNGITDDKAIIAAQKLALSGDQNKSKKSTERMAYAKAASVVKSDKDMKVYAERLKDNGVSAGKIKEIKKNVRAMNKM